MDLSLTQGLIPLGRRRRKKSKFTVLRISWLLNVFFFLNCDEKSIFFPSIIQNYLASYCIVDQHKKRRVAIVTYVDQRFVSTHYPIIITFNDGFIIRVRSRSGEKFICTSIRVTCLVTIREKPYTRVGDGTDLVLSRSIDMPIKNQIKLRRVGTSGAQSLKRSEI